MKVECEGGAAAWLVGTLAAQECRDMDFLCRRSHAPAEGLFFLERLVARGQKASLAGLSP